MGDEIMTLISKADIYALYQLNGKKDDYELNEFTWQSIFNMSPNGIIDKLIGNGFVELVRDPQIALPQLLVPDLKSILKNKDLKVSGRKKELVTRILDNLDATEIDEYIHFKTFRLTDTGFNLLKQHSSVPIIAKYYDNDIITFKNAEIAGIKETEDDPKEILHNLTDYFYHIYLTKNKWHKLYRVLLSKEQTGRHLDNSDEKLNIYLQIIYLCISGQTSNFDDSHLQERFQYVDSLDDLKSYYCEIPEFYIDSIQKIQSGTGITDQEIIQRLKKIEPIFNNMENIFPNNEIEKLLLFSLQGNSTEKINSIYVRTFNSLKKKTISTRNVHTITNDDFTKKVLITEKNKIDDLFNEKINSDASSVGRKKKTNPPKHKKSVWSQLIDSLKKL